MKALVGLIIGGVIGAFLGFVAEPWFTQIAFKVRPGLESLTFWEAIFSDHFWNWLFFYHQSLMSALTTALVGIVGLIMGVSSEV